LAKYSEDILCSVVDQINVFGKRSARLEERLERVRERVAGFDVEKEGLAKKTFKLVCNHYQSRQEPTRQAIVKEPPPPSLTHVYTSADYIPMLRKFAGIREDGMNPEKLISDPSFFFEHWRSSIHLASSRRRSIAIVVERDPSVDPDVLVADGNFTPSTLSKPRSPDLLLETLNPQSSIHRRHKVDCPTIPKRYGDSLPISTMKEQERKTVFELFDVDIPTRCSSALGTEYFGSHPTPVTTPTAEIDNTAASTTPKVVSPAPPPATPHHQLDLSSGKILYQDEDCLVIVPASPVKVKRRFTFSGLRRSFRRSSKDKVYSNKENRESRKGKVVVERRGSFLRSGFRRKPSKKDYSQEEVLVDRSEMSSDHMIPDPTTDSGVDTGSSRTTSVSSAGALGYALKHMQEDTALLKANTIDTSIPSAPPPPPPLPIHHTLTSSQYRNLFAATTDVPSTAVKKPLTRYHSTGHAHSHTHSSSPLVSSQTLSVSKPSPTQTSCHDNPVHRSPVQKIPPPIPPRVSTLEMPASPLTKGGSHFKRFSLSSTHPVAFSMDSEPQCVVAPAKVAPSHNAGNEILAAIERGRRERKAQNTKQANLPFDVAAILERRVAIMCSDDESDSGNDEWDD
jgi:hypothetical protein